jgi:hypothetical protein
MKQKLNTGYSLLGIILCTFLLFCSFRISSAIENTINTEDGCLSCNGTATVISGKNVSCYDGNDGQASIIAAGFTEPIAYEWSNGATSTIIGDLSAGIYTVTVKDANGCTAIESIEITEPEKISVSLLDQSNVFCPGQNSGYIAVNASGGVQGYEFIWSNGANMPTLSFLPPGKYEVTLSDANDCTDVLSVEITEEPDDQPPMAIAAGLSISLDANGKASVTTPMIDGGSFDNCGIDTLFLNKYQFDCDDVGANTILLTVIDKAGHVATDTSVLFVLDNIPPVISCPGNIVIPDGNCKTPVNYTLPTATDNCSNLTLYLLSGLPSGAIGPMGTTEVTWGADDNNGNTVFCTFTVTVESDLKTTTTFTQPDCYGFEDATATSLPSGGAPPYGFEWNDPDNQLTQVANNLKAGIYSVTVTDSLGCIASNSVIILEPDPIQIQVDQMLPEEGNSQNGAISVSVTGGTSGLFTYEWILNGVFFSNQEDISGLSAGKYVLRATDQTLCTVVDTMVLEKLTGTRNFDLERNISVQPNPTAGICYLQFDLPGNPEVRFQLFDVTGRPFGPEQFSVFSGKTFQLDFSKDIPGIYWLRIFVDDKMALKKIVLRND